MGIATITLIALIFLLMAIILTSFENDVGNYIIAVLFWVFVGISIYSSLSVKYYEDVEKKIYKKYPNILKEVDKRNYYEFKKEEIIKKITNEEEKDEN